MSTSFPTGLDSYTNPTGTDDVSTVDHAAQHANVNDAVEAIQAKLGIDSSAVNTSHDYKLSNVATGDKAVSLTGTETLTNKTINGATPTEVGYLSGVTSAIQTQLDAKGTGTLSNIVEDTTPQLGGDLNTEGNTIYMNGAIDTNIIKIPDNIDGNAMEINDDTGGATMMRFKTANGFEEITLYSNTKIDGANLTVNSGTFTVTGTTTLATALTGVLRADSGVVSTDSDVTDLVSAASTSLAGKIEVATSAETNTGTDAGRAVSPDGLAGSNFGIRYIQIQLFDYATDMATGDGKGYIHIPPALDGMNLVYAHLEVQTAGTTGTTDIQIHNVDNALDMLSTKLTVDSAETGSDTAATAYVINTSNDHVNTNDVVRVDVDAVSTTAPKGGTLTLGFQLP